MKLFSREKTRYTLRFVGDDGVVKKVYPRDVLVLKSSFEVESDGGSAKVEVVKRYAWDGETLRPEGAAYKQEDRMLL